MQMLNQQQVNKKKIKKSHLLLIGSFLVFIGILVLSWNHLLKLRGEVISSMQIQISERIDDEKVDSDIIEKVPVADNLPADKSNQDENIVNYDKYLGVLEIPRISLKRGFYDINSKYNNIESNITLVRGSTMPNVSNGNLILMAHSGDAYVSYFAFLYRLKVGSDIYVTYQGKKYHYRMVNIYTVEKTGSVSIMRNYDRTTLTLITCTKDDDTKQSLYIAELVS